MSIELPPQHETYWENLSAYGDFRCEQGWSFVVGNPELWHYCDQIMVPGGTVLDIGAGFRCRESLQFAHSGMQVIAYEPNPMFAENVQEMVEATGLPITVIPEEFSAPEEQADLVILSETFHHMSSKKEAYEVLNIAWDALKPGGHMWVRANGKESGAYNQLRRAANYDREVSIVDEDVINHPCTCSGDLKIDPSLFFDQLELSVYLAQQGATFLHHQVAPAEGVANFMYGEDWSYDLGRTGFISLLVQKPTTSDSN